jgi:ParB family transcriptional regulator, chromosome partitioning protein
MNIGTERRGLGRGLGELFQRTEARPVGGEPVDHGVAASLAPVLAGSYFADLPVDSISPNPRQPRTVFDEEAMNELVESIREVGMLQPVVVRPLGGSKFELVMGERRWRAAQQAGVDTIPAIVRETADHELLRDALLENLHRAQLNPLEEAAAYQQMLEDFGCTQEELSTRIKRSRPQISNTIRLLRLPATVQRRIAAGVISAGHARALLAIEDPASQERVAQRVVAEGLSVRAVEELIAVGDHSEKASRQRHQSKIVAPKVKDLADRLSDHFETRVKVELGRSKGKIIIEFATIDDLERIVGLIESGQMRPEPNQLRPEPNQLRPEPNQLRPEPNQLRPEPNQMRPEPVEGHTINASTSSAHTEPNQYRQSDIQEDVGAGATASA